MTTRDLDVYGPDGDKPSITDLIAFESLEKGQLLTAELLEQVVGYRRDHARYALAVASVCDQIRKERPDLRAHVRMSREAIQIMLDAEAESYTQKRYRECRRGMIRTVERRASIDVAQLSPNERKRLEVNDRYNTAELLQLNRVERQRRAELKALQPKQLKVGKP